MRSSDWALTPLGRLLRRADRFEVTDALTEYQFAGTYSFARGIFLSERRTGTTFSLPQVQRIRSEDFVYCKIMAWEGAFGLVPPEADGAVMSGAFVVYEIDRDRLDPRFLSYYFQHAPNWERVGKQSSGTNVRRQSLHPDDFESALIHLPPIPEQQRIVARIEAIAQELSEAQASRAASDLATEALVTAAVSARFKGDRLWRPLRDAVMPTKDAVRSGPFGSQLLHDEFTSEGVSAIGTRDVQTDRFDLTSGWFVTPEKFETFKRYKVYPGDLLCTIVGASIGRFCVVPPEVPDAFTTKHIQALTLNPEVANSRFCSLMLNFHRKSRASLFSQVEGSAQPSLNAAKVLATQVPLPPLPEQRRVVAEVDALQTELLALTRAQAQTRTELDALLPAILDRAFAGAL